jgi:hypothetical protein
MKKLTVEIEANKYKLFLELIKNLELVRISSGNKKQKRKNRFIQDIARGMQEAKLCSKGKIKSRSAKGFLNEL